MSAHAPLNDGIRLGVCRGQHTRCLLDWSSRRLPSVSRSTGEAEITSLAVCVASCGLLASAYLNEIARRVVKTIYFEDNQCCIATIANGGRSGELRHLGKHPGINMMYLHELYHVEGENRTDVSRVY